MNKITIAVLVVIAVAVAAFALLGKQNIAQAPILDPECPAGYERVGEGCMLAKEACELGGDQYYFDEAAEECLMR